jgi:hypothetical protein
LFRMLAVRRPPGTVAALLAFLPCAENEEMIAGIIPILVEVGMVDGKADEALVKALSDRVGIRRAVAAITLWRGHASDGLPVARKLLTDKDLEVRRRVALELAVAGDQDGAAVLSALLEELPNEQAWEIEEQLERLAGAKAPAEMKANPIDWKKVAGAWRQWWQGERAKIVMTDSSVPASGRGLRGYTLLVQQQSNSVTELGPGGKPRWTLTGLQRPVDAQVLANHHVVVAELGRVTERDLSGNVLWKLEGVQPLAVQRLANGHTFIPCGNQLVEVDRAGKDVLRMPVGEIVAARRLPDRRILTYDRQYLAQLDEAGKQIKQAQIMANGGGAGANEFLDNGHLLVLSPGNGNIIEFDIDGKELGRFDLPGAILGFRLPNGHTLVSEGTRCIELDKEWKPIKETMLATPAYRVKQW